MELYKGIDVDLRLMSILLCYEIVTVQPVGLSTEKAIVFLETAGKRGFFSILWITLRVFLDFS